MIGCSQNAIYAEMKLMNLQLSKQIRKIAVCFDCYEKTITKEVRKQLKKESNRSNFITKIFQEAKELDNLQQIFEGGETHGNKR